MRDHTDIATYGVHERHGDEDALAVHVDCIRLSGYTVVRTEMAAGETADFGARLEAVYARQAAEFGGADRLAAIGDAMTVRCPLAYDEAFLRLATYGPLLALCRRLLGDYIVLMQQNGIINAPDQVHTQRAYHRDLPYQHFVSSRPLAISALFCIDPFTPDTGATTVIPGSHRVERFPSETVAERLDTPVTAEPGSFIVFDSMLFHRAGVNRSGRQRRAVNHVFTVPIIAQQISLPSMLQGRYADDPELARLLGYDTEPAPSVLDWRKRRASRRLR